MHKPEIIKKAIELYENGQNKCEISRELGISRSTIRGWLNNRGPVLELVYRGDLKSLPSGVPVRIRAGLPPIESPKHYAYILGVYLGDGHISKQARTYRLRIFQDARYKNLIERYKLYLSKIFPKNKVSISKWHVENCKVIMVHNNEIPLLFPQHGSGRKHSRDIFLEDWQKKIVSKYPNEFISGLIDSDGCRFVVKKTGDIRYQFTNKSEDIKQIFKWACGLIGVECNLRKGYKNVTVQKQSSVKIMEGFYINKS